MKGALVRKGSALVGSAVLFLILGAVPVLAHHKDGHDGGPKKDKDTATTVTEDNDANDGGTPNNVADEGDNKHPSRKDRSVENGKSGNQGKSQSDPDGDSNGGADKPGGSGGVDLADQDGNNGCGNDDDFEDDNNGNCGGHKDREGEPSVCAEDSEMKDETECDEEERSVCTSDSEMKDEAKCDDGSVSGVPTSGPGDDVDAGDLDVGGGIASGTEVLGEAISRGGTDGSTSAPAATTEAGEPLVAGSGPSARPATMPFTGADILTFLAAGLGLLVTGSFILRMRGN